MHDLVLPAPAVVVGIDGSRRAIGAALWAVDEAIERDLPIRLVYAIEPHDHGRDDPQTVAHEFATAECAVRHAVMAIESTNRPVKIEVEIMQGEPVKVLLTASRSAALLCVGTLGVNHATGKRLGSAATGLLARTHCPVAIVATDAPQPGDHRWVVTEFHESPGYPAVLRHALDEARLRHAPLHVVTAWHRMFPDLYDPHAASIGSKQAETRLERSLARYRTMYPDLDIEVTAVRGTAMDYLVQHANDIQLIVVGHDPGHTWADLAGTGNYATLANVNCSMLVSERHGAL